MHIRISSSGIFIIHYSFSTFSNYQEVPLCATYVHFNHYHDGDELSLVAKVDYIIHWDEQFIRILLLIRMRRFKI